MFLRQRTAPAAMGLESAYERDAALVRALRDPAQRDRAAAETFDRFSPMVLRILARSLGRSNDLPDVVQEVFLRLFARVGAIQTATSLKAFVIGITVNVLKKELKRRELRRLIGFARHEPERAGGSGEAELDTRDALRRMNVLVAGLRPSDRVAFVLRFMESLKVVEVAEATGVSLATVKRRLERARAAIASGVAQDPVLSGYLERSGGRWR